MELSYWKSRWRKNKTGFMKEQGRSWTERTSGKFTIYDSGDIKIWCGDFMVLRHRQLPSFDLIYDKAALTALPPVMRRQYAAKIYELSNSKTQYLLHHFIYNQEEMNGPPFSISHKEISEYFGNVFAIKELSTEKNDPEEIPKICKKGAKRCHNRTFTPSETNKKQIKIHLC